MCDSFAKELHLSHHFLYFAFLTFCMHYSCTKWRKKHLFTLGGIIWFEFSHEDEENGSPVEKQLRVPGWKRSVHAKPPHRPHHITQTQLARGRGHGGLRTPAPASPALERKAVKHFCHLVCFFKHCSERLRSTGCLLKALADVQVILFLPELRESKSSMKSKCHQVNKESGSDVQGFCLSLLKVIPVSKTQKSAACW